MKGKFVLVSTIILAVFMIWLGVSQKETMLVHYYPSVTALSVSEGRDLLRCTTAIRGIFSTDG